MLPFQNAKDGRNAPDGQRRPASTSLQAAIALLVLLLLSAACGSPASSRIDGGSPDSNLDSADAGPLGDADAGLMDGGTEDGGVVEDGGTEDAGAEDGGEPDAGPPDGGHVTVAVASRAVAKVKALMTGLPPTDEEVSRVVASPSAMTELAGEWMQSPEYRDKMMAFFIKAFQQDQWSFEDTGLLFCGWGPFLHDSGLMVQNMQQSFARTVLELNAEGQPFTSVLTTRRFMMTPALIATYATLDSVQINDRYICTDYFRLQHQVPLTVQSLRHTTFEDVVNPLSPDFMTFEDPGLSGPDMGTCPPGTLTYPSPAKGRVIVDYLFNGFLDLPSRCYQRRPVTSAHMRPDDFTNWRMVEIRKPGAGEKPTPVYNVPFMRTSNELVMRIPRVGFFTTPAFAARWQTNDSNLARVQINQTLIVALGEPISLRNVTESADLRALDRVHAAPETTCYQCHQSLDPMRQFFRRNYSIYFSGQDDLRELALPAYFAFHGVSGSGSTMEDLGSLLAGHPLFGPAWAQKLCTWATSAPCDEEDPEFLRLVDLFVSTNYSWDQMAKALFSSPLVTELFPTVSQETIGPVVPVSSQAHLCDLLSARLGIHDICARDVRTTPLSDEVRRVAATWPSYEFSRGAQNPSIPLDPSVITRGGGETLCSAIAERLVDTDGSQYLSESPDEAIALLVSRLMALTSDRAEGPRTILRGHYDDAIESGASPDLALKSTFVVACLSPYVMAVGQ